MAFKEIHFVILNYLTYEYTILLVNDILKQKNIIPVIVIVDNNSPNDSYNILNKNFAQTRNVHIILSGENRGYSNGNNLGLKYISQFYPKYVVILNNDIKINDTELIEKLILEYEKFPSAYLCAPSMYINDKEINNAWKIPTIWDDIKRSAKCIAIFFSSPVYYKFPKIKKTEIVDCVPGSFFLTNFNKFETIGFFDEGLFLFGEETILGYKVKQAGGINLLCRQYGYDHLWSKTIYHTISKTERLQMQSRGKEFFHEKYLNSPKILIGLLKFLHRIRLIEEKIRRRLFNDSD